MTDNDSLQKVYLEITTDCNMSCGMCLRHVWQEASRSMARGTYEKLVAGLRAIPTASTLNFGGFPSCGDCLWAAGFIQCP